MMSEIITGYDVYGLPFLLRIKHMWGTASVISFETLFSVFTGLIVSLLSDVTEKTILVILRCTKS